MMFFRALTAIAIFLLLTSMTACKSGDQEKAVQTDQPAAPMQSEQMPEREYGSGLEIKGKILETMDVGSYTYVQVDDDEGPTWVAIPQTQVETGQEVAVTEGMEMRDFESKTLNRTFDKIYFSAGFSGGAEAASPHAGVPGAPEMGQASGAGSFEEALQSEGAAGGPAMVDPAMLTGGSMAARVQAEEDIQVEKAEGENAYTVGEIFAKGKELNEQKVVIRGKIVKISPMIMGKNWLHIQDGTGDAADSTNDLVVTTMAEPEKGSVVVVEGTLHTDKDFGAGYRYNVIVEDAEIK